MSMLACSYCHDFADTDDGEGHFDVLRVNTPVSKAYEYICGVCAEKYINEDGVFDPKLGEAT